MDEKKKVVEDVEKDRRYAIDAAIVRTMKSRKTLNHQGVSASLCHALCTTKEFLSAAPTSSFLTFFLYAPHHQLAIPITELDTHHP